MDHDRGPATSDHRPPPLETTQQRLQTGRQIVQPGSKRAPRPDDGSNVGDRLAVARRPAWLLSGLVRCGVCNGPMTVMGSGGRLGCANHVERGICDNKRTVLRARLTERVLTGLAVLVYPGERRGEVAVALRGNLAAFLHLDKRVQSGNTCGTRNGEVLGTLVAGTGFEPVTFRL
ncbi:MAG: zinc ribbon domain-containing protein [Rhodopila sp.]